MNSGLGSMRAVPLFGVVELRVSRMVRKNFITDGIPKPSFIYLFIFILRPGLTNFLKMAGNSLFSLGSC